MKTLALLILAIAVTPSSFARFSKFVILTPKEKGAAHTAYHPRIIQNSKSKDFVDVRIPWEDDGKSYWLVLANAKLSDERLDFRAVVRGAAMPAHILAFSPLAQRGMWVGGSYLERPGFIEFTLHKSLLGKAYIYHDFSNPHVLDGGYYYTCKLEGYPVDQGGAEQPATAPESKSGGNEKPKSESEARPR